MVLEVWPTSLPQAFMASGYGEATPKDNIITDDYNVGPPVYRRRTTSAPAPYAGQMFMTTEEWETLSTFFHGNLFDGVMRFLFPPQGVADLSRYWISRFVSPPQRQMSNADDGWFVSLKLERLGIGQSFLAPPAFSDPTIIYQPTIVYDQFLTVARYNNTNTFGATIVSAEGALQTLVPARYNNTNTFYAPSVASVGGTLSPARYDDGETFYAATVTTTGSSTVFDSDVFDSEVFS